ncbi:MAG: transcriptional regulator MntR [Nitrososphaeraceae archaeon]
MINDDITSQVAEKDNNRLKSIRIANNVRKNKNRTPRMEDYLEVIYELVKSKGYATTVEISQHLNVSSPSVTKMIQRLDENNLLVYEKYRGIRLTKQGISIAINVRNKHALLTEFFKILGVNEETANEDVEALEHYLHPESINKLEKLVKIIKDNPRFFED